MSPKPPIELPSSYEKLPFEHIRVSHHPKHNPDPTPVVILTLFRPGKRNAFTVTMMEEIERSFALFDVDDRVKCVVVTGDGKIFCAGADLEIGFEGVKERVNDHKDGYVVSFDLTLKKGPPIKRHSRFSHVKNYYFFFLLEI
jgi:enoyl-CoA hydratase/carnithine racemase